MNLTKRIIPCLDVDKGRVVKGKKFQNIQDVADPVELAKSYVAQDADELVFYDITASTEERDIFVDVVEKVAKEVSIPFVVGGGLRTVEDIEKVIQAGADKVSINSAAVKNPQLLSDTKDRFGKECVVLAIDTKKVADGRWGVFINGGREDTGKDAIDWAIEAEKLGAGEIVVNAIDEDGEKDGYNIELNRQIAEAVNIPIVASGGAGKMEHFKETLTSGKSDAALAASVFHYGDIDIHELKQYLKSNNISIREVE